MRYCWKELNLKGEVKSIETISHYIDNDKLKNRRIEYFNKMGVMVEVKEYCQEDFEKIRVHYTCECEYNEKDDALKIKEYRNGELDSTYTYSQQGERLNIEYYKNGTKENIDNTDTGFLDTLYENCENHIEPICEYDKCGNPLAAYWYNTDGELDLKESYRGLKYTYDQHNNWITCTYANGYICMRKIEYYQ